MFAGGDYLLREETQEGFSKYKFEILDFCVQVLVRGRAPQDVDVLAVLDFQILCFRPESPVLYPKMLLANHEHHGP